MTDQSVSRFWDNYILKTKVYRVKESSTRWYVRYAESYIKDHQDQRLSLHTVEMLDSYLKDKSRNAYLEPWQFNQLILSLKILFVEMVKTPWAKTFPWDDWVKKALKNEYSINKVNNDDSISNTHPTLARDYQSIEPNKENDQYFDEEDKESGLYKRIFKRYPEHLTAFITQIRVRHYSIRTERAYLGWLLRYISFYSL